MNKKCKVFKVTGAECFLDPMVYWPISTEYFGRKENALAHIAKVAAMWVKMINSNPETMAVTKVKGNKTSVCELFHDENEWNEDFFGVCDGHVEYEEICVDEIPEYIVFERIYHYHEMVSPMGPQNITLGFCGTEEEARLTCLQEILAIEGSHPEKDIYVQKKNGCYTATCYDHVEKYRYSIWYEKIR